MTDTQSLSPQLYWEKGKVYRLRAQIARKQAEKFPTTTTHGYLEAIELARKYERMAQECDDIANGIAEGSSLPTRRT